MLLALGHHICCPVQTLFDRDHLAAGETVFAPSIQVKTHQFLRSLDGAHDLIELVQAVRMAMREHGQVAQGERGLLVSDRVQRYGRIGDDLGTIFPRNLAMFVQPVGFKTLFGHSRGGRADLMLGLQLNALIFEGAMIDPRLDPQYGQAFVRMFGPGLTPMRQ